MSVRISLFASLLSFGLFSACAVETEDSVSQDQDAMTIDTAYYRKSVRSVRIVQGNSMNASVNISGGRFDVATAAFGGSTPGNIIDLQFTSFPLISQTKKEFAAVSDSCGTNEHYCAKTKRGPWDPQEPGPGTVSFLGIPHSLGDLPSGDAFDFASGGSISNVSISLQDLLEELDEAIRFLEADGIRKADTHHSVLCDNIDYTQMIGSVYAVLHHKEVFDELVPRPAVQIEVQTHLNLEGDGCDNTNETIYRFIFEAITNKEERITP